MKNPRTLEIHSDGYTIFRAKEVDVVVRPVSPHSEGEGLPYAPSDWPNKGDIWHWRVGRRVSREGFFVDRYLYLPKHLRQKRKPHFFPSRLSIERFVKKELNEDATKFFDSFCWNIPLKKPSRTDEPPLLLEPPADETEDGTEISRCEAGNNDCLSIMAAGNSCAMSCDICCGEPGFCRDCCCILCSRMVDSTHGAYSFIRCQAKVSGDSICGHVAHIDCALRAYLAGTVGGSIGLDVEYYCRRCDTRTPLISHVQKLLDLCRAVEDREDVEKILSLGARILFGSSKLCLKVLQGQIELAMTKIKSGVSLRDMWEEFDKVLIATTENKETELVDPTEKESGGEVVKGIGADEVEEVLKELRKSQEEEYKVAERRLLMQRRYVSHLTELLEAERGHTRRRRRWSGPSGEGGDGMLAQRSELLRRELSRFENMKMVRKGFSHLSGPILKSHFGICHDDDDDDDVTVIH